MPIEGLEFGRITIDGETFTTDVLVFPDGRVQDQWWRARGHVLTREDLAPLMKAGPEEIIAGTGVYGRMRPVSGLAAELANEGIRLTALPNAEARQRYNQRLEQPGRQHRLAACFHLTC
jgi:hypothetical protein